MLKFICSSSHTNPIVPGSKILDMIKEHTAGNTDSFEVFLLVSDDKSDELAQDLFFQIRETALSGDDPIDRGDWGIEVVKTDDALEAIHSICEELDLDDVVCIDVAWNVDHAV